jgi:hypothetical protein
MNKKIRDLLTSENGFTENSLDTISDWTALGTDKRIKITGYNGTLDIDLHNKCVDMCRLKCGIEPDYSLENEHVYMECVCEVSELYCTYYKLFLLEQLIRKDEKSKTNNEVIE